MIPKELALALYSLTTFRGMEMHDKVLVIHGFKMDLAIPMEEEPDTTKGWVSLVTDSLEAGLMDKSLDDVEAKVWLQTIKPLLDANA